LLLKGDGKGHFTPLNSQKTGFVADKDVRSLAKIQLKNGSKLILIGNNSNVVGKFIYR
jgi:enediyne biosynthesis protein E4